MNRPSWRVPPVDKQVLLSLTSTVLVAKLDAQGRLEDLRQSADNVALDDLRYWEMQAARLEAAHAWLLELLGMQP